MGRRAALVRLLNPRRRGRAAVVLGNGLLACSLAWSLPADAQSPTTPAPVTSTTALPATTTTTASRATTSTTGAAAGASTTTPVQGTATTLAVATTSTTRGQIPSSTSRSVAPTSTLVTSASDLVGGLRPEPRPDSPGPAALRRAEASREASRPRLWVGLVAGIAGAVGLIIAGILPTPHVRRPRSRTTFGPSERDGDPRGGGPQAKDQGRRADAGGDGKR